MATVNLSTAQDAVSCANCIHCGTCSKFHAANTLADLFPLPERILIFEDVQQAIARRCEERVTPEDVAKMPLGDLRGAAPEHVIEMLRHAESVGSTDKHQAAKVA